MAAGDVFNLGVTSVSTNSYFNIQPNSGVEVVIHNITHSADAQLEFYDGSTAIAVDIHPSAGAWMGMFLHCTDTKYYRVKNTNAASATMCCDGVVTK
jgi:molybdopterin-binding protein